MGVGCITEAWILCGWHKLLFTILIHRCSFLSSMLFFFLVDSLTSWNSPFHFAYPLPPSLTCCGYTVGLSVYFTAQEWQPFYEWGQFTATDGTEAAQLLWKTGSGKRCLLACALGFIACVCVETFGSLPFRFFVTLSACPFHPCLSLCMYVYICPFMHLHGWSASLYPVTLSLSLLTEVSLFSSMKWMTSLFVTSNCLNLSPDRSEPVCQYLMNDLSL